jgi:glycosyltransferase involved in cell wall biosynthesis
MHDPVPHSGEENKQISIRHLLFKNVDRFLLYSSFSTEVFKKNFPEYISKTLTLNTPVYHNLVTPVETNNAIDEISILFFGRISPYKGVELFYNAAKELATEFNNVKFIIAGKAIPGYAPDFLNNNTNKKIQIINQFVDLKMLSKLMSESSLCVLPYIDATQSGVVMTCYAYNLPLLVSDCPGLLEYCFDVTNFSFENGNLTDLKNKIHHLLTHVDLLNNYKDKINAYADTNVSRQNVHKILTA